jgi:transcription initiation factor TFIIIB Brf1 subunit/transcription initiation factor TFIIB
MEHLFEKLTSTHKNMGSENPYEKYLGEWSEWGDETAQHEYENKQDEQKKESTPDEAICEYCKVSDRLDKGALITCMNCGYVQSRAFDSSAEYRYYANDDRDGDPSRVGAPQDPRLPEASLGTIILNGHNKTKSMYKVRKYHSWNTMPYKERALIQTYERLSLIGLNHGINQSAIDNAKSMFITLQDIGGRQGLCRDALLSASLYLSLKQAGTPRKPKEVADIFGLQSSTFTKALKQTQEILAKARQRGVLDDTDEKVKSENTHATEFIDLPLSRLPISRGQMEHLRYLCHKIAEKADSDGLSQENMPHSLAAGCIAFVLRRYGKMDISLSKIASVSDISVATMQKCLRRLENHSDKLEEFMRDYIK